MIAEAEYVDRRGSNCNKWDNQKKMFGENDLLGLWVADMDFRAADCVRDALRNYVDFGIYGYSAPSDGYYGAFIDWERTRHGYAVQRDWLRFSPGVVPAINWFVQMMTQPGDGVAVLTPVYYPFLDAVKNNSRTLIPCELLNRDGVYSIDFDAFEETVVERNARAFILCSPHNPVGRVWKREELRRLLDICRAHGIFVISDEIHQDLVFGENRHIPSATVGDYDRMLVTLTAPSKTFNLAGCQNSLVIIPDPELREKYDRFTQQIRIFTGNPMGYIAAEAAYRGGQDWLDAVKTVILGNFRYARRRLGEELPLVRVSELEGTYLMWADFAAYLKPEEMQGFFQKKCRLALDFGAWFGGDAGSCVRFNLATSRENVAEALERIVNGLRSGGESSVSEGQTSGKTGCGQM